MSLTVAAPEPDHADRSHLRVVVPVPPRHTSALTEAYLPSVVPTPGVQQRLLIEHVAATITDLVREGGQIGLPEEGFLSYLTLMNHLLDDGSPTPQVSLGPGDGIATEWLVDGASMTIFFRSEADIHVWAENSEGVELFDFELTSKWSPADPRVQVMQTFLEQLGHDVRIRVPLRPYHH